MDLFLKPRRDTKQMCQVSLKDMEPNGGGNDLKISSFLVFFKMSLCEIQSPSWHHGLHLNFALRYYYKLQNEPMMTVIHLFSHVLWVTKDRQFLQFLPLKRPFARETKNTLKSGPDSLLVFQHLKINSGPSELIRTTMPISKDNHQY